jgi:hypothetical protein
MSFLGILVLKAAKKKQKGKNYIFQNFCPLTDTKKVCRYQKDNHKSEIKRQTIQWPKEKRTNKYQYT